MQLPVVDPARVPSVLRCFHPVLASKALSRRPVQVTVADKAYALFRNQNGKACAVEDRCPHRFAPLSGGRVRPDGRIACPYHGWHFDGQGEGISPSQPSLHPCKVRALKVVEQAGYIWLGEQSASEDQLRELAAEHAGFELAGSFDIRVDAAVEHVLDIFSDAEHPAWVHKRLAWTEDEVDQIAYAEQRNAGCSRVQTSGPQRISLIARLLGIRRGDTFNNHWLTRFEPVRGQYHVFWMSADARTKRKLSSKLTIYMIPERERVTRIVVFIHTKLEGRRRFGLSHGLLKRLIVLATRLEVSDDARFLVHMKDAPLTTKGMRLGRLDGVILHNRRLLERLYFRRPALPASSTEPVVKTKLQARA